MVQETLVLGGALIRELLPPVDCIEVIDRAMRTVSRGGASLPLRIGARAAQHASLVAAMPGYLEDPLSFGGKLIAVTRGQPPGKPSHQGVVVLFDPDSGAPLAILDAHAITALRTAAATAVATRALAAQEVTRLAILGAGEQAETHVEALTLVRDFDSIAVWSRSAERTQAFAKRMAAKLSVAIEACASARAAVVDADVICTVTAATEPVLEAGWVRPGAHVNLVGASSLDAREADDVLVQRASFFVDFRPSALAQAGELAHAFQRDAVRMAAHIRSEIGEVLNGAPGRRSDDDLTVYKSLGIAAQDLAAARIVYERARERGQGIAVRL